MSRANWSDMLNLDFEKSITGRQCARGRSRQFVNKFTVAWRGQSSYVEKCELEACFWRVYLAGPGQERGACL